MQTIPPITSLTTFPVSIPFVDGGEGTGATPSRWHTLDMVLVRVEDEDGNVGWGIPSHISAHAPLMQPSPT